ncbi:MAG: aminopeptidase, partial [Pseudoalteromonas tetraodonis]|nr:aminopeptidase [Pseudoalteromonas tetraodonis]
MKKNLLTLSAFVLPLAMASTVLASSVEQTKGSYVDKFRQLDEALPTPNVYRSAAGAPAENYWQQRVDYDIDVTLDEQKRRLTGSQTIEYKNNSPHTLKYLWL